jgi:hypothetical protein
MGFTGGRDRQTDRLQGIVHQFGTPDRFKAENLIQGRDRECTAVFLGASYPNFEEKSSEETRRT